MQPSDSEHSDLRVVDLRKSFSAPGGNRIEVLKGVSLEVRRGETVAIVGASGSGKSTLLHLLGGLEEADNGSILLGPTDIGRLRGDALNSFRQKEIGFIFQFHYLLSDLSAVENVALPLRIARQSTSRAMERAEELLREIGLEQRMSHPTNHLSGGEQQRVALARSLVNSPQILLADEPTGNLDALTGEEVGQMMVSFVRKRAAMAIIATHNENLAALCDRTFLLSEGRLRASN